MCGIAGLISSNPSDVIVPMLSSIEHRGRDNEGVYLSPRFGRSQQIAALGHRRLAIIDTSANGNQPFVSASGRFHITYNGELYNYKTLREELLSRGHSFKTRSDTEVLLAAFEEFGVDCFTKLNGMFAFSIWDEQAKELTIARDRAGIKPLFYAENANGFLFASEIKSILASGLVEKKLDREALQDFLTFLWPVPPKTMFEGVSQLMPGHYGVWKEGKFETKEWWDLDFSKEEEPADEKRWIEEVAATMESVTDLEMVADVDVGAFLSGGVDSSTIVALMAGLTEKTVKAYTTAIAPEDLEFDIVPDDVKWSRQMAKEFALDYHEQTQRPDLPTLLPQLVASFDAPIVDMAVPTFLISSEARKTLKVMLSGMGGDEVFAGYPRHLAMKLAGYSDLLPTAIRRPLFGTLESIAPGGKKGILTAPFRNLKKFSKSAALDYEDRYLGFGTYFDRDLRQQLVRMDSESGIKHYDPYRQHRAYFKKAKDWSPLNRLLYVDFKTFMPALNLDTTDRMSMAANLEVRVPFLNHELVSLTERLPVSLKLSGFARKYALKKAAERWLPKEVIWRKKAGFSAPVRSWVRGALKPLIGDLLGKHAIDQRGIFDADTVAQIIQENESGAKDFNLQVFQLLTFEMFMREYFD